MYDSSGNMIFADNATTGRSIYGEDYKSTGQSFSDMLFSIKTAGNGAPGIVQVGLNIKNYITDENKFTLKSTAKSLKFCRVIVCLFLSVIDITLTNISADFSIV